MSYYFDTNRWTLHTTPPGLKIPTLAAMALAPILGAVFIMFLPVIGFWLTGQALAKRAVRALDGFWALLSNRTPVGEAHLTGAPISDSDGLEEITAEVERARGGKDA